MKIDLESGMVDIPVGVMSEEKLLELNFIPIELNIGIFVIQIGNLFPKTENSGWKKRLKKKDIGERFHHLNLFFEIMKKKGDFR
jgi:hypothetical protein